MNALPAISLRVVGAALLGTNAGIHAYLYDVGYRNIPDIGVLFLLDVIGASILTLVVLGAPRRLLILVAALGALFEAGTVSGLLYTTYHVLFDFKESSQATLYWQSVWTEVAGVIVLGVLAIVAYRQTRGGAL